MNPFHVLLSVSMVAELALRVDGSLLLRDRKNPCVAYGNATVFNITSLGKVKTKGSENPGDNKYECVSSLFHSILHAVRTISWLFRPSLALLPSPIPFEMVPSINESSPSLLLLHCCQGLCACASFRALHSLSSLSRSQA